MSKLPKRQDYDEIEKFKPYELIQCVAYEMAMRAPEIRRILEEKAYEDNEDKKNSKKGILKPTDINKKIWNTFKEHGLVLSEVLNKNYRNNTGKIQSFFVKCTNNGLHKISANFAKDGISGISINDTNPFMGSNSENAFSEIPECNLLIARPLLKLKTTKRVMLDINFSLPTKEIQAQIEYIKKELESDTKAIVSPIDIFNDIVYAETDKLSKKLIADMFFIYDYISVLLDRKKLDNENLIEKHNNEIMIIKENVYNTWSDKETQIIETNKNLQADLNKITIMNIIKDKKTLKDTHLTESTIKRYYYNIKPYIEELKYKELITGIKHTH